MYVQCVCKQKLMNNFDITFQIKILKSPHK